MRAGVKLLCVLCVRAFLLCLSPTATLEDVIAARINYESAERYACTRGSAAAAPGARELITTNQVTEPGALAAGQPERRAHCPARPLVRATTAKASPIATLFHGRS